MTPTPRQREEWERKRNAKLRELQEKIDDLETKHDYLRDEYNRIELTTIEDSYFEFLAEQGSER